MIRKCSECGAKNRIPASKLARQGKCGGCKASLGPLATPLDVQAADFKAIMNESTVPVLVDFWAEWCGPCRMAAPEVQRVAKEMAGKAIVLKVDTEANPDLARQFQVSSIPNFMVLKGGKTVMQKAGLVKHAEMKRWLEDEL